MAGGKGGKQQLLGAARAESDRAMLDVAFVATADFEMLRRGPSHNFVVGRRGAGKSALYLQLLSHFRRTNGFLVVDLKPEEYAVKGLLAALKTILGASAAYDEVRALTRVVWRSVILAHVASAAISRRDVPDTTELGACIRNRSWLRGDALASAIELVTRLAGDTHDHVVYAAAKSSGLEELEQTVRDWLARAGYRALVLVDGLDEGWRTQDFESGVVGGLCAAAVELRDKATNTHVLVFLRDNMFRILGDKDADFSRNIAGDNLRLTWDHAALLDLVARRLRALNELGANIGESSVQTWNRFAKYGLQGKDGFVECLQHTLYRPRDTLELLNTALQSARRKGRAEIVREDVEQSALDISKWRLTDLFKEYEEVLPGLESYVGAFSGRPAIDTLENVIELLESRRSTLPADAKNTFVRLGSAENVFQSLFGIGFLGIEVSGSGFQFCHDGTDVAGKELALATRIAVHPCYARALDVHPVGTTSFDVLLAVNDEYDEGESNVAAIEAILERASEKLVGRLATIKVGDDGAHEFEEWTRDVLTMLFSEELSNIALHPNKDAPLRRDIVGANDASGGLWRRLLALYKSAQVVFEVKNYERLGSNEFSQARAYMGGPYGNAVFIVYRSLRDHLDENERSHVQQHYAQSQHLIVLVPVALLQRCLQKTLKQSSLKYARRKFNAWVDQHERIYINPRAGAKG